MSTPTGRSVGGEVNHDGDFVVFEGNHFRNGFLYKNFGMSAIVSGSHILHTALSLFVMEEVIMSV